MITSVSLTTLQGNPLVQFTRPQTTLAAAAPVSGFGFWSGLDVDLVFHPAAQDTGVVFVRLDLPGQPRIAATLENRIDGPRRTSLQSNGASVEMVEHVLSALAGMKIDNCEVHVNQAEMPGMDGSSLAFVEALVAAGRVELDAPRAVIEVRQTARVGDQDTWIEIEPVENGRFELGFELDYRGNKAVGQQAYYAAIDTQTYRDEIAPARTFVLDTEAEQLRQQGLGKRVGHQDLLVFNQTGPIDNELRYENECARHKVLDMIGDFALAGTDIVGKFTASKTGHRLNSHVVAELLKQQSEQDVLRHNQDTTSNPIAGEPINKNRLSA